MSPTVAKINRALAGGLRVALVHDWLTGMRGGEKVLEAMAGMFPGAPIYTLLHIPGSVSRTLESHPIHTSFLQRWPRVHRHYRGYLPFFPAAIEDLDVTGHDLILSSSHCVAKGIVPAPSARHICYCHTPMRYAWDQEHAYFPRRRGVAARLRNLALTGLRSWDVATVPRVDQFVANSRFVAERIRRYYGRRAATVPPPVDIDFFVADSEIGAAEGLPEEVLKHDEKKDFCLVVSALAPYKRIDLAIVACERLGLELRIVGSGPERRSLERLAGSRTRFLGRVAGGELRRLYRSARFFLQPGVEDFGIAAVEALASGTPVVALGRGGVLDIVVDGEHGVLYDEPDCPQAVAAAIDKSLKIRFNKLKLTRRAQNFSVHRFRERLSSCVARQIEELEAATR